MDGSVRPLIPYRIILLICLTLRVLGLVSARPSPSSGQADDRMLSSAPPSCASSSGLSCVKTLCFNSTYSCTLQDGPQPPRNLSTTPILRQDITYHRDYQCIRDGTYQPFCVCYTCSYGYLDTVFLNLFSGWSVTMNDVHKILNMCTSNSYKGVVCFN